MRGRRLSITTRGQSKAGCLGFRCAGAGWRRRSPLLWPRRLFKRSVSPPNTEGPGLDSACGSRENGLEGQVNKQCPPPSILPQIQSLAKACACRSSDVAIAVAWEGHAMLVDAQRWWGAWSGWRCSRWKLQSGRALPASELLCRFVCPVFRMAHSAMLPSQQGSWWAASGLGEGWKMEGRKAK